MSTITELGVLPLAGTKNGKISISNVTEPYGKDSEDIVSIGILLNGKEDVKLNYKLIWLYLWLIILNRI